MRRSATITFDDEKSITSGNTVVVDGAGLITLDGDGGTRHFAVEVGASLELRNITLSNGQAGAAGSIANEGDLAVVDSLFSSNTAVDAGAIFNAGTMMITGSAFNGNTGTGTIAGAILNAATGTIVDSTFTGNSSFFGGVIVNAAGTLDISGSTFSGNSSLGVGGVVYNLADLTITNSTLSNNTSNLGGAIYNLDPENGDPGSVELVASTVTGNTSTGDGSASLYGVEGGIMELRQSIVADQSVGSDCFGVIISNDNNLDSDNTCNLTGPNDIPTGNADVGPLADNGGPTLTHLPQGASQAIDSGGEGCPDTDQRGRPRPSGAACDIGSVEIQTSSYALCASYFSSRVYSPFRGGCGAYQLELVVPDDYPLAFCIDPWTGTVNYPFGQSCNSRGQVHVVPDDGELLTCVNGFTSINRQVLDHSPCNANEVPNVIPVA